MDIPKDHPNTHHLLPYWLSDSPRGIRKARRQTPRGYRCFKDINVQALLDDEGIIHYGTPRKNGYDYYQVNPFKRRKLTVEELDRPFHFWPKAEFKKLRRTKRRGLSYESRVKPMVFRKAMRICRRWDVIPCFELKSWQFANVERAKRMASVAGTKFFMALFWMGHCLDKGKAIISTGNQFAILAHGEREPQGLVRNYNYSEIWGHFS